MEFENVKVVPMTEAHVDEYLDWEYEEPMTFYNFPDEYKAKEKESILEKLPNWWAVTIDGELIGIYEYTMEEEHLEIGLGLAPKHVGKGYGEDFINMGFAIASEFYLHNRYIMMVWKENERAIHLYEKLGFEVIREHPVKVFGESVIFLEMLKEMHM